MVVHWGQKRKSSRKETPPKTLVFLWKRHDNQILKVQFSGWPRFGSVRLRFSHGTVRAVPVFGSDGSSGTGFSVRFSTV